MKNEDQAKQASRQTTGFGSTVSRGLRAAGRSAGLVGTTLGLLAPLEVQRRRVSGQARMDLTYRWVTRWGRSLLSLYGLEVDASGPYLDAGQAYPARDTRGVGRMFVMNHRSLLDIFIALAHVEANILSRHDLAGWPVIGFAARRVGTLVVNRPAQRSGAAAIEARRRGLARGAGVLVYPEGTTFEGDEVRAFKRGAFLAAEQAEAEVVPVGVAYDSPEACYGEGSFAAHYARIAGRRRTRVSLCVGAPIPAGSLGHDEMRVRARQAVQDLVDTARRRLGGAR